MRGPPVKVLSRATHSLIGHIFIVAFHTVPNYHAIPHQITINTIPKHTMQYHTKYHTKTYHAIPHQITMPNRTKLPCNTMPKYTMQCHTKYHTKLPCNTTPKHTMNYALYITYHQLCTIRWYIIPQYIKWIHIILTLLIARPISGILCDKYNTRKYFGNSILIREIDWLKALVWLLCCAYLFFSGIASPSIYRACDLV